MATTTGIKFYSQALGAGAALSLSTSTSGSIVFDKTSKAIYVNGIKYGGSNVSDATFANNVLTINRITGVDLTLDFSSLATTASVMAVFNEIKGELTMGDTAGTYVAQADESYVSSDTLTSVNTTNVIDGSGSDADNVDDAIAKVDKKAKAILGEVITAKKEIDAIETGAGLGTNGAYTADSTTNYLKQATSLTDADKKLDTQLKSLSDTVGGLTTGVSDVQINSTSIKSNGVANIAVDGTYNSSTNKIATVSTVTGKIGDLDTDSDVQAVVYTAADTNNGAKLTFKGVSETNGVIAQGTGSSELQFAKVATTGAAENVSIADTGSLITATTVEGALAEIAAEINGMDLAATALMTKTDDATNGNTTFTISGIQETDGVVSLASTGNATFKTDGVYSETSGSENLIATKATVTAAVNAALDSEVTFKGVTGTLPSNPTNGDMYKASTSISIPQTSAGEGAAITAATGDTIIYKNVSGATDNGWYVITSGDESFSDTWRAINVNGTQVLGSGISTGAVNFANGTLTTVTNNSGTITINHNAPTADATNTQAVKIQLDSYGHIVGTTPLTIGDLGGVSGINHGTDGNYITINITDDASDDEYTISGELTLAELSNTYGQYSGPQYVSGARHGLLTDADVAIMKNYIDWKAPNAAEAAVNALDSIADADEDSDSDYATITTETPTADFKVLNAIVETDGKLTAGTAYNIKKVAATAAATDMTVTSATYGGSTATTNLQTALTNLSSAISTSTAVVDGSEVIVVNSSSNTTVATVGGNTISTKVAFYWEEYS